jgi:hypothetical protein
MNLKNDKNQTGFAHIILIFGIILVVAVFIFGFIRVRHNKSISTEGSQLSLDFPKIDQKQVEDQDQQNIAEKKESKQITEICKLIDVLTIKTNAKGGFTPYGLTCIPKSYTFHKIIASYSSTNPVIFKTSYLLTDQKDKAELHVYVLQIKTVDTESLPVECDRLIENVRKAPCQFFASTDNKLKIYHYDGSKYSNQYYSRIDNTDISLSFSKKYPLDQPTISAMFDSFIPIKTM